MEIQELKAKIQELINQATEKNNQQKQILSFLFEKLNEIRELETIDRLRQFPGGNKYLLAYLTYKSIARANYQMELLKHTDFDTDEQGPNKLLESIAQEIEQFEKDQDKTNDLPLLISISNEQLLKELEERRKTGEIILERDGYADIVIRENEEYTKDKVNEFLKKHKLNFKDYDQKK